ncbi:RNA polymerase sigma factor [Microbacterium murale]|uniref:DNA-directed RNA polymerase sigma-70 factor n=1 Tax=Microbacterium murale TaxID=1081040 RepID=A0ABQ1S1C1_9MICO|nr:sigma-70 family RNA polymerase sigma factor [Microbacterium murale]GGD90088.1 DNA-directed RNA polymerase sigma-70 factor [Microbacterium murale]
MLGPPEESIEALQWMWSNDTLDLPRLVDGSKRALFAYFARRVVSTEDAADLTGEVMLTMWQKSSSLPTDPTEARMWAFGIARNVLANHSRSIVRRRSLSERLKGEALVSGDTRPVRDDVWEALRALPEIDREIIQLVHWDGFSLADAARVLGKKPATVRSRYSRARAKLRAHLTADVTR